MDEAQVLFNVILGVAGFALGWIVKIIWDVQNEIKKDMRSLNRDVQELERQLPETYVRRDDWRDQMARIEAMLNKIVDKLDAKVDKADK